MLMSRPAELDRQVAYSGLAELFGGVDDEIAELPGPFRRALRRVPFFRLAYQEPGSGHNSGWAAPRS